MKIIAKKLVTAVMMFACLSLSSKIFSAAHMPTGQRDEQVVLSEISSVERQIHALQNLSLRLRAELSALREADKNADEQRKLQEVRQEVAAGRASNVLFSGNTDSYSFVITQRINGKIIWSGPIRRGTKVPLPHAPLNIEMEDMRHDFYNFTIDRNSVAGLTRIEVMPDETLVLWYGSPSNKKTLISAPEQKTPCQLDVVNIVARDGYGKTSLFYAVREGNAPLVIRLLGEGADEAVRDNEGNSPLHEAAYFGYPGIIELLIKAHEKRVGRSNINQYVNTQTNKGETPLDKAIYANKPEAILMLQKYGAIKTGAR